MAYKGRLLTSVLGISLLLVTVGCPKNASLAQKAALASENAAAITAVFQNGEIAAHEAGDISAADHVTIEKGLVTVSDIGTQLDKALRAAKTDADASTAIGTAIIAVDALSNIVLENKTIKASWSVMIVGIDTTLKSLQTMLG